jgi:hypothetical protein
MKRITLLVCGILNLFLAGFHLAFWKLFDWKNELPKLQPINQGIMQVFNSLSLYIFVFMALTSFDLFRQKQIDRGSRMLLFFYGGFYLLRAVLEYPFFGWAWEGLVILLLCLILAGGYFWNAMGVVKESA